MRSRGFQPCSTARPLEDDPEWRCDRLPIACRLLSPAWCFSALAGIVIVMAIMKSRPEARDREDSPREVALHASRIDGVAFSPDGRFLASASSDCSTTIYDFETNRRRTVTISKVGGFSQVAFSPDGKTLAASTLDGRVVLSDLANDRAPRSFRANETEGSVTACVFSPDGSTLATGGDDRAIHVWDVLTGSERLTMRGHEARVRGLAFTPDGGTLLSVAADGRAISWNAGNGRCLDRFDGGCGALWSVAVSRDGRWAALGGKDGITLRDLAGGRSRFRRCVQGTTMSLGFLPCGTKVASASLDGTITLWKLEQDALEPWRTLQGPASLVSTLAMSSDGLRLASGGDDGILRIWRCPVQ
jgi:WD40 repeat protein